MKLPIHRILAGLCAGGLVLTIPATAHAERRDPGITRDFGNGPERNEIAATDPIGIQQTQAAAGSATTLEGQDWRERGYPRQQRLRLFPEDPTDRSIKLGLGRCRPPVRPRSCRGWRRRAPRPCCS